MKKFFHLILLVAVVGLFVYSTFPDTADAVATSADIPAVKAVALKLADKSVLSNKDELRKILSKKTVEFMDATEWKMVDPNETLIYVDAIPSGNNMIVAMKDEKGLQLPMTFVKEDGQWKVGLFDGIEEEVTEMEKVIAAEKANTTNKKADLIIAKIEHSKFPNALDPKTQFKVTVKNKGTFTSSAAQVDLNIYTAKGGRHSISSFTPALKPGESTVLVFDPFSDIDGKLRVEGPVIILAGTRKVVASVNNFKRVPESNYTNNSLTKNIYFIRKAVK